MEHSEKSMTKKRPFIICRYCKRSGEESYSKNKHRHILVSEDIFRTVLVCKFCNFKFKWYEYLNVYMEVEN